MISGRRSTALLAGQEGWRSVRLKFELSMNASSSETDHLQPGSLVTFLPMEAIGVNGELDVSRTRRLGEVKSGYTYLADGDIALAKITPCFENGKCAIATPLINSVAFATTEVLPLRPRERSDARFFYYLLASEPFRSEAESTMYGAGGQKRVPDSAVANHVALIPPAKMRQTIARFLDQETTRIDTLIDKQKKLIELLKEKRRAVISQAVTKGLDPDVPMKDSGVEWLGEVPEHWIVRDLKFCAKPGMSISYGIVQPGDPIEDGVPFLQTTNITGASLPSINEMPKTSAAIEALYPRSRLKSQDVILGIRASIGAAHVVPIELEGCNLSRGIARIEPADDTDSRYLRLWLSSEVAKTYWAVAKQGSTFSEISIETVKNAQMLLPPMEEQRQIVKSAGEVEAQISRLIDMVGKRIALLQERRSALITAAVTGQIDVSDYHPDTESTAA